VKVKYIQSWSIVRYKGKVGVFTQRGPGNKPTVHFDSDAAVPGVRVKAGAELEIVKHPAELAFGYLELARGLAGEQMEDAQ